MISSDAKDSFSRIFFEAARSRLPVNGEATCEFTPCSVPLQGANATGEVVVLTISSMQFRLLLLLHFDAADAALRDYYVRSETGTLDETFMEVANLCCGSMNQQLVEYFPDLGMSTPYTLNSRCVPYLDELKPAWRAAWDLTLDGTVRLGATLCVCANVQVDFHASVTSQASSSGELELF